MQVHIHYAPGEAIDVSTQTCSPKDRKKIEAIQGCHCDVYVLILITYETVEG